MWPPGNRKDGVSNTDFCDTLTDNGSIARTYASTVQLTAYRAHPYGDCRTSGETVYSGNAGTKSGTVTFRGRQ